MIGLLDTVIPLGELGLGLVTAGEGDEGADGRLVGVGVGVGRV